jgi:hypothetical protein
MYNITVDRPRRIVCVSMSGFFSEDEVSAFARDEQAAAASLRCPSGQFGLLLDAGGGVTQSQDVIGAFQALMVDLPLKAGRIAIVSGSALLKLQLRRIMTSERTGVFDTIDDARTWIEQGLTTAA